LTKKTFLRLLALHREGKATQAEKELLARYYDLFSVLPDFLDQVSVEEKGKIYDRLQNKLFDAEGYPKTTTNDTNETSYQDQTPIRHLTLRKFLLKKWLPYAAILLLGFGLYFFGKMEFSSFFDRSLDQSYADGRQIPGGKYRATLKTKDGASIELSAQHQGIIVGDKVVYPDGQLVIDPTTNSGTIQTMELATPSGGTYQITLSDGTRVWLNAQSTLTYPAQFAKDQPRVVALEGEAYFEVTSLTTASGKSKTPFYVQSAGQTIEVLGTSFNVNAYSDQPHSQTTLVEGKVQIQPKEHTQYLMLLPGQQANVSSTNASVKEVKVENYVSWKEGWITFHDKPLESILNELARWYQIEIIYEGEIPNEIGYGMLKRTDNLSVALRLLESGGIRYQLEGNKLYIL
jgi:transmembrane sensor